MAEIFNADQKLTLQELAQQLRQPDGEIGKTVGYEMNKGNRHICLNTYKVLKPSPGNHILEIGMGNGFFVKNLLSMADDLTYKGVDYSSTMIEEAQLLNENFVNANVASFHQASIENLPFNDNTFECISTTNTLYFWPDLRTSALEILRVLKPGGRFIVAYRGKSCMDQMELTQHGFKKYEAREVEEKFREVGFTSVESQTIPEPPLEMDGKKLDLEGIYTTAYKR